jgi:hypothetical protein
MELESSRVHCRGACPRFLCYESPGCWLIAATFPPGRIIIWEKEGRRVCALYGELVINAAYNVKLTSIFA